MATFTQRSNGQWQARVRRLGYPSLSKTFKTKTDATKWARATELAMDRDQFVSRDEGDRTTLKKALERYQQEVTPDKKGATAEANRIKIWITDDLSLKSLTRITSSDMAEYRDRRKKEGKSASTIRNELNIISHLYTIAIKEWGMTYLVNPISNIKKPSPGKGRERRLKKVEEVALLEKANFPLKQFIVLALETGMRLSEIMSLTWNDVDFNKQIATLEDTKNGERRRVPLSTTAIKTMKDLPRQIDGRIFKKVTSSRISHLFRELCIELEIDDLRFHDLRHESTSRLFERGFNIMEVASITGHKTLAMLKRYTHPKAEDLAKRLG